MRNIISLVKESFKRLTPDGRKTLTIYTSSLVVVSGLDAVALLILAKFFQTSASSSALQSSTYFSVGLVIFLFLSKSLLSTGVSYVAIRKFAEQEVFIGQENYQKIEELPWTHRKNFKQSDYFTLVDRGPNILVQGLMLSSATVVAESLSALVIVFVLFFTQPVTAVVSLTYFLFVVFVQHRLLSVASSNAGFSMNKSTAATYDFLGDGAKFSKILQIMPSLSFLSELEKERKSLATARAKVNFLATLPRYFMETILALGFVVIAGFVLLLQGPDQVLPAISLFAAAGFRLLPIFNRIQGGILSSFSYEPIVRECLSLESEVELSAYNLAVRVQARVNERTTTHGQVNLPVLDSEIAMRMVNVSYKHQNSNNLSLEGVSLSFEFGKQYAIVGPSGSGKTTLVDIVLGLLPPASGTITWNEDRVFSVAYVPQDTCISVGSLFQNIAIEWSNDAINMARAVSAMRAAKLEHNFDDTGKRVSVGVTEVENLAMELSGGQKQRLGLARAFYRDPNFIVLDEATSSLDAVLEREIMEEVEKFRDKVTTVIVAHRLSTIQNADQIIYIEDGKVLGIGTFRELIKKIPAFEAQVKLGELNTN